MKITKNMKTMSGILTIAAAALLLISTTGCDHSRYSINARNDRYSPPVRQETHYVAPARTVYTAPTVVVVADRRDDRKDSVVRDTTSRARDATRTTSTKPPVTGNTDNRDRDARVTTRTNSAKPPVTGDKNNDRNKEDNNRRK